MATPRGGSSSTHMYSGPQAAAINKFSRRSPRCTSLTAPSNSSARCSLPVPGPLSLADVAGLAIFHIFRKPLTVRPIIKLAIYLVFISAGSLFFDLIRPPTSFFFSNKRNFLNRWFVRFGWAWTLWPLLVFVTLSSLVYCNGQRLAVLRHVSRLGVATGLWWLGTSTFNWIENRTGLCYFTGQHPAAAINKPNCATRGGNFVGFDISGHIYMLVLCNLVILEEVGGVICRWSKLRELVFQDGGVKDLDATETNRQRYTQLTPYVKALAIFLSALSVLWDLMIIMTTVYFHNLPSKLISVTCVAAVWFLSYQVWYPFATLWLFGPASPGHTTHLNFMSTVSCSSSASDHQDCRRGASSRVK